MREKESDKDQAYSAKETNKSAENFEKKGNRRFNHPPKKDPQAIPILKDGPSNNFMLFKEAM
jgi:hypothetical protein